MVLHPTQVKRHGFFWKVQIELYFIYYTIACCNIYIFSDSLIRTHYYKYFHPKECYIPDSNLSVTLSKEKLNLIYPFGCTLNVIKPSFIGFTSGCTTFPVDRPLGALYFNEKSSTLVNYFIINLSVFDNTFFMF